MKIYTRQGDAGRTRLMGGAARLKSDLQVDAYGTLDELNGFIGASLLSLHSLQPAPAQDSAPDLRRLGDTLHLVQHNLFNVGSFLACEDPESLPQLPRLHPQMTTHLEQEIDHMTATMPPLREFILPGGSRLSCDLQLARTVCRRAERRVVAAFPKDEASLSQTQKDLLIFINRLSDFLFVAARWANFCQNLPDVVWKKDASPP